MKINLASAEVVYLGQNLSFERVRQETVNKMIED